MGRVTTTITVTNHIDEILAERGFISVEQTGQEPLLGQIPLEHLGLEPDLKNQVLRILPAEGKQSYIRV